MAVAPSLHPLQRQVRQLGRRELRLQWQYALARWLAGMLLLVTAAASADYWLRLEDPGLRWLLSLTALTVGAWWLVWLAPWRQRSDLQVARSIESAYPQLRDQLTSSLEFLAGDSAVNSGSLAMQLRSSQVT